MVDYATHYPEEARNRSMFNTPPVFPIFVMYQTLKWVKEIGGVEEMYRRNKEKAAIQSSKDMTYTEKTFKTRAIDKQLEYYNKQKIV